MPKKSSCQLPLFSVLTLSRNNKMSIQWPSPDAQGLYSLSAVKDALRRDPAVQTLPSGQKTQPIKGKLAVSDDGTKALWASIKYSDQWFILLNCQVNGSGEIVYEFAAKPGKKTADGTVARIQFVYSMGEGFVQGNDINQWFKIT